MALLFAVMLTTAAGNTAMQSVMPSIGTHLGIADVWVSLAYSWSALLWMLLAPFWARRSDRRGRKAMMSLGMAAFALSFALCGTVLFFGLRGAFTGLSTILLFALARSLYGGFGSAAPPAVQAYVASRTSREERTKALSMVSSSFGLGTVLGPALAPLLILPGIGLVGPFAIFALFAVGVLVLLRMRLPDDDPRFSARGEIMEEPFSPSSNPRIVEDDPDGSPDELPEAEPLHGGADRLRWSDPRMRAWLWTGTLGGQAQSILLGVIGFLLLDRLGLRHQPDAAAGPIGLVLMCGAVATLLAQWGLIPTLGLGPRTSTLWGMGLCCVGVVPIALGPDLHTIATGFAICSLGFGLFRPGFTSGASLAVTRREQGQSAGIVAAVNGSAYIVTPAIGVFLYNHSAWLAWVLVEVLALSVLAICLFAIRPDEAMPSHGRSRSRR
ncbi:MFS transporter [Novosphingobium sp. KCTC 2891]|uniref:MFS transporter n=1 Tax=Novosphingobium sp. KCTC 2891 TaxID=2989730 RepID=UPI0022214A20|nr:MFS transporter [Novosphingobium sp. KCTC 2891]